MADADGTDAAGEPLSGASKSAANGATAAADGTDPDAALPPSDDDASASSSSWAAAVAPVDRLAGGDRTGHAAAGVAARSGRVVRPARQPRAGARREQTRLPAARPGAASTAAGTPPSRGRGSARPAVCPSRPRAAGVGCVWTGALRRRVWCAPRLVNAPPCVADA